jgi:cell division protein FtsI (penicillin-binding protein 3)
MTTRRTGLGEARTYHPRGRTVRERQRIPAARAEPAAAVTERAPSSARGERSTRRERTPEPAPRGPVQRAARRGGDPIRAALEVARTSRSSRAHRATVTPSSSGSRPARPAHPARPSKPAKPPKPPKLASPRRRLRLATAVALTLFAMLGVRLVELQLTEGPAYAATGLQNRLQTVTLPAARGAIYDRNDAVLAHSVEARFVYADPELVDNPEATAELLQPVLGIPASELAERMAPRTREDGGASRFEWLARGVDIATADRVMELNLPGIGVDRDERRVVPGHDLAANLIGFTGEDLVGLEGLEASFDELLRGVDGMRTFEVGHGATVDTEIPTGHREEIPPQPGSDLRLTVDMDLQYEVQRLLAEQLRSANATFGSAVVLDPRTGEVLAQASYPGYDAADPLATDPATRRDAATSVVFDPGSSHKPLVYAAALEEGVIEPGDTVTVNPTITMGDETFHDTAWFPPGTDLTLAAALAFSSNVATIQIADRLGPERLYAYQQAFGLGQPTDIGLPGEATGALLAPEDWSGSSHGSVPIGHSVDVTALQMAAAYGAIANDGVWVQPRLLQAVVGQDGTEQPAGESASHRVLSADNAAYLRELLEAVVTVPNATGTAAALEDYRVAGKTGTGNLVQDGRYAPGEVASFVGMAPADAPRYVIAVVAHTPQGTGGEVASPAFREMMDFTLNHYRVPPSATEPPSFDLYG